MAIEFFNQEEEVTSLDFLPDALEENPKLNGKLFDVFSFKKAKSGKGYMLYTSDFICWFFKKDKVLTQALEALDYYCKIGSGYQFVVMVDKKLKSKFSLGIDTDREVKYVPLENASYRLALENDTEDIPTEKQKANPFLFKKQNPSLPPLNTETLNNGDEHYPITPQGAKGRREAKLTS
jgi:hypothetical protein